MQVCGHAEYETLQVPQHCNDHTCVWLQLIVTCTLSLHQQREVKRLKRAATAGHPSGAAASEPTSTTQPPAAHAWSDLGFGSTEQKETLAMLQVDVQQLASHIMGHLSQPRSYNGIFWKIALQTHLKHHMQAELPTNQADALYILHHALLWAALHCADQVQQGSVFHSQPLARVFSAPGAQVILNVGEQHWKQAHYRAWFMTGEHQQRGVL
jgi:hypothetical protein